MATAQEAKRKVDEEAAAGISAFNSAIGSENSDEVKQLLTPEPITSTSPLPVTTPPSELSYKEFMDVVNGGYTGNFTILILEKPLFGGTPVLKPVSLGKYIPGKDRSEAGNKYVMCFEKQSVILKNKGLMSQDVKIFKLGDPTPAPVKTPAPRSATGKRSILQTVGLAKGGRNTRKAQRKSMKKRSTRRRRH